MPIGSQQRGMLVIVESKGGIRVYHFGMYSTLTGMSSGWGFALACRKAEDGQFEACNLRKLKNPMCSVFTMMFFSWHLQKSER